MTILDMFLAVAAALVLQDIISRIISEISYHIHIKKHNSILDRLKLDEE